MQLPDDTVVDSTPLEVYKEMYDGLFNKTMDIVSELQGIQEKTEELFVSLPEATFPKGNTEQ